jgi:RNA polymerase sigma factor (sigma-70 family)
VEAHAFTQESLVGRRGPAALLRLAGDERLVALTRSGDAAAFETIVARYQSRLLSFCARIVGSREDAEDVLQEVFAASYKALRADSREINLRPWLYRIARNRSLNHLRRHTAIGVDSMDVHFADMGISTSEKVFKREEFKLLLGDIHKLPESQRTALLLREIEGLSYEQIAETMDTTVSGIKSLLVRARLGLGEASEARALTCDDVRLALAEAAEGVGSLTPPIRRHLKSCERCSSFRSHLRASNRTLAALAPFAPLLLIKQLVATKLGASAGGAGATVGGGAAAAGGATAAGSSAGALTATAVATKAIATVAAAALLTAGAVTVGRAHTDQARTATLARPVTSEQVTTTTVFPGAVRHRARHHAAALATLPPASVGTPAASGPTTTAMPSEAVTTTTAFPGATTGPSGATSSSMTATAPPTPAVGAASGSASATAGGGSGGSVVGASGASGTTGTSGASSATGTSGASGASGPTGASGTGASGPTGATGS